MTKTIPTIAVFPEERLTLDQKIEKWVWQLCRTLEQNYQLRYPNNPSPIKFRMKFGKKYIKVIQQDEILQRGGYCDGGVHAFVDKKTGQVYKPASYKAPAKHVRYDLRLISDRSRCYQNADWAGGYLYLRG